jgi:hypothetical protein
MRVDGEGFFTESCVQHDVGGLAADARERLKLLPSARNFAAMMFDQRL